MSRRRFVEWIGVGGAVMGLNGALGAKGAEPAQAPVDASGKVIAGFDQIQQADKTATGCQPFSDRKIRVGIVGYGLCKFGAAFGFQDHPNVEVAAVTDLIPDRCAIIFKGQAL